MSATVPLVIYGAGGLGSEIYHLVVRSGRQVLGFIDDAVKKGININGVPVLGGKDWLMQHPAEVVLAFGDPGLKQKIFESISRIEGVTLSERMLDPKAVILDDPGVELGRGTMLTAGVVLTTRIKTGMAVLVNLNTTIGHDTVIGDFTSIMPGCNIAGNVRIGRGVLIGSGVNILGGLTIGDGAVVGAGAVVNHDVEPRKIVVGVPARAIKSSGN